MPFGVDASIGLLPWTFYSMYSGRMQFRRSKMSDRLRWTFCLRDAALPRRRLGRQSEAARRIGVRGARLVNAVGDWCAAALRQASPRTESPPYGVCHIRGIIGRQADPQGKPDQLFAHAVCDLQ
jgi:hypothetical protein